MSNAENYSSSEIHDLVLDLFRKVLGNPEFPARDDFFDHGGDSIKGVEVLHGIRDLTGVRLTMSTLYLHRSPDELAAELTANLAE